MKKATVVSIDAKQNEQPLSVLRRFSRKMTESGILRSVRARRYHARPESAYKEKKSALTRIDRRRDRERLQKLGKWVPKKRGHR